MLISRISRVAKRCSSCSRAETSIWRSYSWPDPISTSSTSSPRWLRLNCYKTNSEFLPGSLLLILVVRADLPETTEDETRETMTTWFFWIALALLVAYFFARRPPAIVQPRGFLPVTIDSTPDTPKSFGYKTSWLAIRTETPKSVIEALSLEQVQPANWHTGIAAAYQTGIFVSPSVAGWVLVVSCDIPDLGSSSDPDCWGKALTPLARGFSALQYFSTHRVVEYQAWARFANGELTRAYAWLGEAGETLIDFGNPTDEEIDLGHDFFDSRSPDADSEGYWDREDLSAPRETDVMNLAGMWSVDPTELEERTEEGLGWYSNSLPFEELSAPIRES